MTSAIAPVQVLQVAADHLVDPGAGVVDLRFAALCVHRVSVLIVVPGSSSIRSAVSAISRALSASRPVCFSSRKKGIISASTRKTSREVCQGLFLSGGDLCRLSAVASPGCLVEAEIVDDEEPLDLLQAGVATSGSPRSGDPPSRQPRSAELAIKKGMHGLGRESRSRFSLPGCPRTRDASMILPVASA